MQLLFQTLVFVLVLAKVQSTNDSPREERLLSFRKMMKVFVRYNVKVNVVPYTSVFAFAMGFRGNWDVMPASVLHSVKRLSAAPDSGGGGGVGEGGGTTSSAAQYQRAVHTALQGGFDFHGLNGTACLQRTFCEVGLINQDDIISRILKTVFNGTEDYSNGCSEDLQCPFSFVDFVDHILTGNLNVLS